MKLYSILACAIGVSLLTQTASVAQHHDYPIQPVPFTHVHVHDDFCAPKMQVNATVTIPHTLKKSKENGRRIQIRNSHGLHHL
ncbi:hypothetical protein [Pontibacter pamirensis]|uniref:hypothetical protein n=1 Tax=Pontibacter pamirensis TaxID=2562824 RepID=UPI001389DECA|nr:hypothetical protein [Pontibacter pamirensis]